MIKNEAIVHEITPENFPENFSEYKYLVKFDTNGFAIVENAQVAQQIAAALNFFDTAMASLAALNKIEEVKEVPDKFTEYIVAGSWIGKIGYDYKNNKLRVWKLSDNPTDGPYSDYFTHLNVPSYVWKEVSNAPSVGGAYNKLIRGKYQLEEK